jgi:hypothetical protein
MPCKTTWRVLRLRYRLLKMPRVKIDGDTAAVKTELALVKDIALETDSALDTANDRLNALEAELLTIEACGAASANSGASANDETASFTAESKRNVSR